MRVQKIATNLRKADGNWSSFQLANEAPPQSVIGNLIAPPARIARHLRSLFGCFGCCARRARNALQPGEPLTAKVQNCSNNAAGGQQATQPTAP
jgi:hypothetical protein